MKCNSKALKSTQKANSVKEDQFATQERGFRFSLNSRKSAVSAVKATRSRKKINKGREHTVRSFAGEPVVSRLSADSRNDGLPVMGTLSRIPNKTLLNFHAREVRSEKLKERKETKDSEKEHIKFEKNLILKLNWINHVE